MPELGGRLADVRLRAAEAISSSAFRNDAYRHGDYFAVGTDPLDRNRLWTISHSFPFSSSSYNNVVSSVLFEPAAPPSPPPVPDGRTVTGGPVRVARAAAAGDVTVTYDAGTCPAPGHHLVWYDLASLSGYTVAAQTCAIGTSGSWTGPAPAGDVGVVVVSDDSLTVEGSHGLDSAGAERPSVTAACGITTKTTTGTCRSRERPGGARACVPASAFRRRLARDCLGLPRIARRTGRATFRTVPACRLPRPRRRV